MQCCSRAGEMGAFCLAKAPLGACVGSPFWPQEKLPLAATAAKAMVPLPPGLCWGQGCESSVPAQPLCSLLSRERATSNPCMASLCGETGN